MTKLTVDGRMQATIKVVGGEDEEAPLQLGRAPSAAGARLDVVAPPARLRTPGTVPGLQEIFSTHNPHGMYSWGRGNVLGGPNHARK